MYEDIIRCKALRIPDGLSPLESYKELRKRFTSEVVFDRAREAFFRDHPDCPRPKPIRHIELLAHIPYEAHMPYPFEAVAEGYTRAVLFPYTEEYEDIFCDKEVMTYEKEHWDDELMRLQMMDFNSFIRPIDTMLLHSPHRTWRVECKCEENGVVRLDDEDMDYLKKFFGYHGHDEELKRLNEENVQDRPKFFYVGIGIILKHNVY